VGDSEDGQRDNGSAQTRRGRLEVARQTNIRLCQRLGQIPIVCVSLQRLQEEARADAFLIAPFIGHLNADEPGKFEASRAALQALEKASRAVAKDHERPMFAAVNKAIEAVAVRISPPTDKSALTPAVVQQIDSSAQAAPSVPESATTSFNRLKDAVVYIQVDRNSVSQQEMAEKIMRTLRTNSVIAPGIEKLATSTMPNKTQIRYFYDSDLARAEELAAVVTQETKLKVFVAKPKLDAKPGTLELWFGKE
jgi:hypothetical protein